MDNYWLGASVSAEHPHSLFFKCSRLVTYSQGALKRLTSFLLIINFVINFLYWSDFSLSFSLFFWSASSAYVPSLYNWADPQGTGQLWACWLSHCLGSCQPSSSTTQQRAEPLLYNSVSCQEIPEPHLWMGNHPFLTRKVLYLRNLFSSNRSLCLVLLP